MTNPFYIHKITTIGTFHENYCEDYACFRDLGEKRILMSVLDGCTMGHESYFASALIGKLVQKIAREFYYQEYVQKEKIPLKELLKLIFKQLFFNLKELKNTLQLERNELLSTILLGIVDTQTKMAEVMVVGDGLIGVNGKWIELEQNNQPDYLGYHLAEEFETWYQKQEQYFSFSTIRDLSLATDGIFTFSNFENKLIPSVEEEQIIRLLLQDQSDLANERMFEKKLHYIKTEWGLKPTDDLGIVRLSFL